LKILRYIFGTICLLSGIASVQMLFSYSMYFGDLIVGGASYFLAAYLFIAPLTGRDTIPANWSEQKIAVLFLIPCIAAAIFYSIPLGFLAVALGIKLNVKEERGYSKIINKTLKVMAVIFVIVIFVVVAYAHLLTHKSDIRL